MAIDSKAKRASTFAIGLAPLLVLPPPAGTIDAPARLHVGGWMYRGIAAAAGNDPEVGPRTRLTLTGSGRTRTSLTSTGRTRLRIER